MLKQIKEKNVIIIFVLFVFILLNCFFVIEMIQQEKEKENIFRIHIVANSNLEKDQIIKLKVVESIMSYLNTLPISNPQDATTILAQNSSKIIEIANETLKENNINYTSHLDIGNIYYDKKENIDLQMDSGIYPSARLVLGKGEGKNFWTLLFPTKEDMKNIENLETILPGISNIYENDSSLQDIQIKKEENTAKKEYTFKLLEWLL